MPKVQQTITDMVFVGLLNTLCLRLNGHILFEVSVDILESGDLGSCIDNHLLIAVNHGLQVDYLILQAAHAILLQIAFLLQLLNDR
jgi:hypothetical protein